MRKGGRTLVRPPFLSFLLTFVPIPNNLCALTGVL
jgi:hypothetical protein